MEYYGKQKCRILKEIRAEIARNNDIEWVVEECKHKGNCRGTCPKCEAEVVKLEKELARRQAMGKAVAVVGISAALSLTVTGCETPFVTQGDMAVDGMYPESTPAVSAVSMGEEIPPESMTDSFPPIPGEAPEPAETESETETEAVTQEKSTQEPVVIMGAMPLPEGGQ